MEKLLYALLWLTLGTLFSLGSACYLNGLSCRRLQEIRVRDVFHFLLSIIFWPVGVTAVLVMIGADVLQSAAERLSYLTRGIGNRVLWQRKQCADETEPPCAE